MITAPKFNLVNDTLWELIQGIGLEALVAVRFVVNSYKEAGASDSETHLVVCDVLKNSPISVVGVSILFNALWDNDIAAERVHDEIVLKIPFEGQNDNSSERTAGASS